MSFVVSQSPFIFLWSINLCWSTMSIYISWLPKFCWFIIFICVHDHLTLKLLLIHYFALCLHDHQSFNKTLVIQNSTFIFIIIKTCWSNLLIYLNPHATFVSALFMFHLWNTNWHTCSTMSKVIKMHIQKWKEKEAKSNWLEKFSITIHK
jgi:hypothetical protein